MRAFKRILYGIVAALGLSVVIILTQQQAFNRTANELGSEALAQSDFEFFISSRYYHTTPIIEDTFTMGDYTFDAKIYNVANIRLIDGVYDVVEGFEIILHQPAPPYIDMPFSAIITTDHETIEVEFQGYQVGTLPVYVFLEVDERSTMFAQRRFTEDDIFYPPTTIEILHFGEIIGAYDVSMTNDDFQLTELLNAYLDTNDAAPTEAFDEVGYGVLITVDSTEEVIRNGLIYVGIVLVIMYLIFVYRKQRLGKAEATEGLKKDIMKLKDDSSEKR